ncbi:hypothetical protein J6590_053986 [Homalodisca vitripennis]|nr:hypothetical protein J6590_053986 [Homalodisca vitripennis]
MKRPGLAVAPPLCGSLPQHSRPVINCYRLSSREVSSGRRRRACRSRRGDDSRGSRVVRTSGHKRDQLLVTREFQLLQTSKR